jgi:hypothetical protein
MPNPLDSCFAMGVPLFEATFFLKNAVCPLCRDIMRYETLRRTRSIFQNP